MTKFKVRIIVRNDLQLIENAQEMYAVILTTKIFRMLMTMIAVYDLETHHLNVINAFLNVENDEEVFCYMSNDYKQSEKMFRIIKILYEQKKSSLL